MLRLDRSIWALAVFAVGFAILIAIVSHYFLIPALHAGQDAAPEQRRQLAAVATLLLAVVLAMLCVGVLLVLSVRRRLRFMERSEQKTKYIDAWAESARRLQDRASEL